MSIVNIPHIGLEEHVAPWHSDLKNDETARASFKRTVNLLNYLPNDIAIATRDGLRFMLAKKIHPGESRLVIRIETYVVDDIKKQLVALMNAKDIENSKELEIANSVWLRQLAPPAFTAYAGWAIRIEYSVPLELLKKYGGKIYLKDIDYAISLDGINDDFYHPHSRSGEIMKGALDSMHESVETVNDDENVRKTLPNSSNFIRSIKIIDNAGIIGPRWTKIGKEIFVIRPHKDTTMRDGIYVLTNTTVTNGIEKSEVIADRYPNCDDVPHFKLHKSYLEALNDEVSAETRKLELAIREIESKELEPNNRMEQAQLATRRLELERDNLKQEIENIKTKHNLDMESWENKLNAIQEERRTAKIKEEEERKSARRRGVIELLKSIPVIITAAIGVIGLIAKFSKPSGPKKA